MNSNDKKVNTMILEIKDKIKKMEELEKQLEQLKASIKNDKYNLWKECKHEKWLFCSACPFDDPCKWYCAKCTLWKDGSLYQ